MSVGPWNTEEENFKDQFDASNHDKKHPTLMQLCLLEAVKTFTERQRVIWDYLTLDNLTQLEVGHKLGITQQAVADHMDACGVKIKKWAKRNKAAYKRLRQETRLYETTEIPNGLQAMRDTKCKTSIRHSEEDK